MEGHSTFFFVLCQGHRVSDIEAAATTVMSCDSGGGRMRGVNAGPRVQHGVFVTCRSSKLRCRSQCE
jgi:hypothetical protein